MNELFEFSSNLNIKKVIGIACLAIFVIAITLFLLLDKNELTEKEVEDKNPYKEYVSQNGSISLELPKRYNLKELTGPNAMQLQSDDGLTINIEERQIIFGRSLIEIANSDKNIYTQKFQNTFDVSDLTEFTLTNSNLLSSYKYSFKYINEAIEHFIQVLWIQGNSQYYVITLSIPNNIISMYQGIDSEIISSFKAN